MLTSTRQERQLDPRYRRTLSFGDVLDESIGLFRRHWAVYALVSAACLLPAGLIEVAITAAGALDTRGLATQFVTRGEPDVTAFAPVLAAVGLISLVSGLFALAWAAAIAVTTDDYLHGVEPDVLSVIARVLGRYPIMLAAGLLAFLGLIVITLAATLLVVVSVVLLPILILGILGAIVGLIIWWVKPAARTVWLKWLIVVATPFGLPIYFGGAWSLGVVATVLEHHGPVAGLRRSMQLVHQHWFRTIGILAVAGAIVSVLQYIPTLLVQLPLTIVAVSHGQTTLGPTEQAISLGAGIVTQVLCASMAAICYAVLFMDLRNRREGTDIAERLNELEANA